MDLRAAGCCSLFPVKALLPIHFVQHWAGLWDPEINGTSFDVLLSCEFAQLQGQIRLSDQSTMLHFGKTPMHFTNGKAKISLVQSWLTSMSC